jgi:hypothetical protein
MNPADYSSSLAKNSHEEQSELEEATRGMVLLSSQRFPHHPHHTTQFQQKYQQQQQEEYQSIGSSGEQQYQRPFAVQDALLPGAVASGSGYNNSGSSFGGCSTGSLLVFEGDVKQRSAGGGTKTSLLRSLDDAAGCYLSSSSLDDGHPHDATSMGGIGNTATVTKTVKPTGVDASALISLNDADVICGRGKAAFHHRTSMRVVVVCLCSFFVLFDFDWFMTPHPLHLWSSFFYQLCHNGCVRTASHFCLFCAPFCSLFTMNMEPTHTHSLHSGPCVDFSFEKQL